MTFMKPSMVAGVAALMLAGEAALAQEVIWINISLTRDSHQAVAIATFAAELERLTEGRYDVETFYAGSLGAERESIEGVQLGTLEMTFTSTGPVPNFVRELQILDVPFLFRDYDHARGVLDGEIGDDLLGRFEAHGIKGLAWADNGFHHMTNDVRPIEGPEDLEGLRLRTTENPIHIAAYRELSILPAPMALAEVFAALQQGVVDGQENTLSVIEANDFSEVQRYLTLTGHVFSPCVFLMNLDLFNGLPPEDQAHFIAAAQAGAAANRVRVDEDEAAAMESMRAQGMEIIEEVDRAAFEAALVGLNDSFEAEFGSEELDRIRAFQ